jgi:ribosome-binding factor A
MQGLDRARGHVRSALGARLEIRFVPELLFRLDESIERGSRVVALMHEIAEEGTGGSSGRDRSGSGQ